MRVRVVTALVGVPLLLLLVFWPGGAPLVLAVGVLATIALWEFYRGARAVGAAPAAGFGYAAVWLFLLSAVPLLDSVPAGSRATGPPLAGPRADFLFQAGFALLLMASLVAELARRDRAPLRNLGPTWLGAIYIGWLFPYTVRVRLAGAALLARLDWYPARLPDWLASVDAGAWLLLFTLGLTWAADTGAYLVGKRWGRHRMAPVLSPGKTWEGLAGGFVATVLVAGLLGAVCLRFPLGWSLATGLLIGALAPLGDLVKSAFKREIGIKDFGALIPGHGGVLDRFDSLLFTAPAVYFSLLWWP
ncbi:MAG: phosphatidate cytidylyltransferase [Armatimonadetes bacterium]|nr:phosphatidate cytidylyltransferase [Armatimonadota bacterium]